MEADIHVEEEARKQSFQMLTCMILSIINGSVFQAQRLDFILNPDEKTIILMLYYVCVWHGTMVECFPASRGLS